MIYDGQMATEKKKNIPRMHTGRMKKRLLHTFEDIYFYLLQEHMRNAHIHKQLVFV